MKNLPTLRNDSSFAVQFSISVSKTKAILLFKIKIKLIEIFEPNERMPGMRSAEDQADCLSFGVHGPIYGRFIGFYVKSAHGPHGRDVAHILTKVSCFLLNSFHFCRLRKR